MAENEVVYMKIEDSTTRRWRMRPVIEWRAGGGRKQMQHDMGMRLVIEYMSESPW